MAIPPPAPRYIMPTTRDLDIPFVTRFSDRKSNWPQLWLLDSYNSHKRLSMDDTNSKSLAGPVNSTPRIITSTSKMLYPS